MLRAKPPAFRRPCPFLLYFGRISRFSANSQRHVDRQDIHAIGGVEGDLSNSLTDDGCKVGTIGIEAQLGTMPDVGHMMPYVAEYCAARSEHRSSMHSQRSISGKSNATPPFP